MSNVRTLKDIKDRGYRLGSTYEQELEKKLRSTIDYNSEIIDYNEKLQAENSEFQRSYADIVNKTSQSRIELEAKHSAELKSLKSNIKSLKRERTLAQKASSANKIQILSLEAKIRELEGKLEDKDLERTYHNLDVMGGVVEEPVQISSSDPKEIDSLRLELERVKEDLNSKEYIIKCMEKGIESSNSIFRQEIDALYSARSKLREENISFKNQLELKEKPRGASHNEVDSLPPPMNNSLQLGPKGILPTLDPTISVGGAEAVPLLATTPIIANSLISLMEMLEFMEKSNTEYPPNQNYFLSSPGISEAGLYDRRPEDRR
ncbi:unnamed protein product [Rhizophagus irregularis]|nr:unnamed protein product [Rhizophagus irregularis]